MRPSSRRLLACLLLGALLGSTAVAEELAPPYDLYEAGPFDDAVLGAVSAAPGPWQVLQQERRDGRTWMLLALPEGRSGTNLAGWGRPRYLGRVRAGERVVYAAPADGGERLRVGRSVTLSPSGGAVLVTRERPHELARLAPHGFQMLGRSVPMVVPEAEGPPERFREVLQRAQLVRAGLRTAADVEALRDQVRGDSLEQYVRSLSETALGNPAGRYYADPETESSHRFFIADKFDEALGAGSVSLHGFRMELPDGSDSITVNNIVAKYASSSPNPGAVMITAHYDAIGLRTDPLELCNEGYRDASSGCDCAAAPSVIQSDPDCAWSWEDDPAPGADDNASGVAAMIETARILAGAGVEFDFDLYFVAFQGEELGLIGSKAFADSLAQTGTDVWFVLNMDMIANSLERRKVDVVANESSEWLADYIIDSQQFVPDLPAEKYVEFFGRSDHANFWSIGVDALLLIEDKDVVYWKYHTFQDRWDEMLGLQDPDRSRAQFAHITQLVVSSLARLAVQYDVPDLAIPSSEVAAVPLLGNEFQVGKTMQLSARVFNFGTSYLAVSGDTTTAMTAKVSFWDGDPAFGGTFLGEESKTEVYSQGGFVTFVRNWAPPQGTEGFHEIHAVVEGLDPGYGPRELTSANNRASVEIFVGGPVAKLLEHYTYPNPHRGSFSNMSFCYQLTASAEVRINVYNVAGELVGRFFAEFTTIDEGNQTGINTVRGRQFRGPNNESDFDLGSGVYVYAIRTFDGGSAQTDVVKGRFAIVD